MLKLAFTSAILVLSLISIESEARAKRHECLLGETTSEWQDPEFVLQRGLVLGREVRVNRVLDLAKLSPHQRFAITRMASEHLRRPVNDAAQAVQILMGGGNYNDILVQRVVVRRNNQTVAELIVATNWPGDNEYGAVFLVDRRAPGSQLRLVARIQDSEISDCSILNP